MNTLKKSIYALIALLIAWSFTAGRTAHADVTDNFRSQISFIVFDALHDEEILVITDYHGLVKQTANADGSSTNEFQVNAHGTAIGLESGTEYVFNDTFRDGTTTTSTVFTESFLERTRLVSPGSADNLALLYELVYHIEGGVVTIDVFNQQTESHG